MANVEILNQKDGLTGFHTKQGLYEYLTSKTQSVYSRSSRFSVIILDLDKFKDINDSYGHLIGDDALRHFCMAINKALRGQHFVARYGGDEFIVVVPDTPDGRGSMEVAKRVKMILNKEKFFTSKGHIRIKTSIGIAYYPDDAKTGRGLLEMADQALYYAKEHGRNIIVNTRSLRKRSIKDNMIKVVKILAVVMFVSLIISAYRETNSLRGVIGYFQSVSHYASFTIHKKSNKYNYSIVELKDGMRIEGWIISEDPKNLVFSMTRPRLDLNPFKSKYISQPIIIPKAKIHASIKILK